MNVVVKAPSAIGAPPQAMLSLYRGRNAVAFGNGERKLLTRLGPHLTNALDTLWRVNELTSRDEAAMRSLDMVSAPLFLVDRQGKLLFMNAAGNRSLSGANFLEGLAGRLAPSRSLADTQHCAELLRRLPMGHGGSVRLRRKDSDEVAILSSAPLGATPDPFFAWPAAVGIVWLTFPVSTTDAVSRCSVLFGLTAAETRLLKSFADGGSVRDVARTLGISIHTARTQLKAVQAKSGWRTQAELLKNLALMTAIGP